CSRIESAGEFESEINAYLIAWLTRREVKLQIRLAAPRYCVYHGILQRYRRAVREFVNVDQTHRRSRRRRPIVDRNADRIGRLILAIGRELSRRIEQHHIGCTGE